MLRRYIGNIISVIFSFLKFSCLKLLLGKSFSYNIIERFSPNVVTEFNMGSKVVLGEKIRVHSGCKIKARPKSKLYIGDNVKINYNCVIVCRNSISIGEGTEFGPSVYIYDHDHDFRVGLKREQMTTDSITIGKNCWIGANTIILKGTTIGDNSVVGAGSVIKGEYPSNSTIIQKRTTNVKLY